MNKVEVTREMIGLCYMQVCAEKDATDEEILQVCNSENPSGTTNGWVKVIRDIEDDKYAENMVPGVCANDPERLHFLIVC